MSNDGYQWYRNYYHCDSCDTVWDDDWTCRCNDKCPDCGAEIEPFESEEL